jgi:hypothetical protein
MTKLRFLVLAVAWLALMVPALPAAEATTLEYSFTVTTTSGPLITTATGTFSYDTSSIIPGGTNSATGLLTALNFTWDGIHYDKTTANTGLLSFDAAGQLTAAAFGTNCNAGGCTTGVGSEDMWDFDNFHLPPNLDFFYAVPGAPALGSGTGTFSFVAAAPAAAPEPSAFALLGVGLAGIALTSIRRRRHRPS